MGIIIILSVVCATLIILTIIGDKHWNWDLTCVATITLAVMLGIGIIVCSIVCIFTQASKPTTLYELSQERESLVESYNTYYNNYDKDFAHSQSLKEIRAEIAEFNAKTNKNNYFCDNFFVNWFYIDCTEIEPITITNGTADWEGVMFEIGQIIDDADGKQYIVTEIQGIRPILELLDDYIARNYVVKNKYGENCTIKELISDIKKEMSDSYERCKDRR